MGEVAEKLRKTLQTPLNPLANHENNVVVRLPWMGGILPFSDTRVHGHSLFIWGSDGRRPCRRDQAYFFND